jgi:hypothetical protein
MDLLPHLTSHESAEMYALTQALALEHLGNLLAGLERHLGESVIFDPAARIQEQTIRDGVKIGRALCEYMVAEAKRAGLGPEPMEDRWRDLLGGALAFIAQQHDQA